MELTLTRLQRMFRSPDRDEGELQSLGPVPPLPAACFVAMVDNR
jgi:hypothetical protein